MTTFVPHVVIIGKESEPCHSCVYKVGSSKRVLHIWHNGIIIIIIIMMIMRGLYENNTKEDATSAQVALSIIFPIQSKGWKIPILR